MLDFATRGCRRLCACSNPSRALVPKAASTICDGNGWPKASTALSATASMLTELTLCRWSFCECRCLPRRCDAKSKQAYGLFDGLSLLAGARAEILGGRRAGGSESGSKKRKLAVNSEEDQEDEDENENGAKRQDVDDKVVSKQCARCFASRPTRSVKAKEPRRAARDEARLRPLGVETDDQGGGDRLPREALAGRRVMSDEAAAFIFILYLCALFCLF